MAPRQRRHPGEREHRKQDWVCLGEVTKQNLCKTGNQFFRFVAIAVIALFTASCAVMFVGPNDEVTDKAINDLQTKTEQFLAKMDSTRGSYSANKGFYDEAKASVRAIRLRAEVYGKDKNKGELDNIDRLQVAFDQLSELHRAGPLAGQPAIIARGLIETNFQALIQIELSKKRSSGVSAPTTG